MSHVFQPSDEELLNHPLLQVAGIFAIGEPRWADRHDEYLAVAYVEDHADEQSRKRTDEDTSLDLT